MPAWVTVLVIAIGGAMIIEGAVYTLFPRGMKRVMREMMDMPEGRIRNSGLFVAAIGLALILFLVPRL